MDEAGWLRYCIDYVSPDLKWRHHHFVPAPQPFFASYSTATFLQETMNINVIEFILAWLGYALVFIFTSPLKGNTPNGLYVNYNQDNRWYGIGTHSAIGMYCE